MNKQKQNANYLVNNCQHDTAFTCSHELLYIDESKVNFTNLSNARYIVTVISYYQLSGG